VCARRSCAPCSGSAGSATWRCSTRRSRALTRAHRGAGGSPHRRGVRRASPPDPPPSPARRSGSPAPARAAAGSLQARSVGHAQIEHEHVRTVSVHMPDRGRHVAGLGDHFEPGLPVEQHRRLRRTRLRSSPKTTRMLGAESGPAPAGATASCRGADMNPTYRRPVQRPSGKTRSDRRRKHTPAARADQCVPPNCSVPRPRVVYL
jgi:hypothetical protein